MLGTEPNDFNELLFRVIDESLSSLGESVKQAIYFHIENEVSINRKQIPENLQAFQKGLEKIFGVGAQFIEVQIMKNLHAISGNSLKMKKRSELEFIKYIDATKENYRRNSSEQAVATQPRTLSILPAFTVSVSKP
jgi:hypothetical protein